MGGLKGAKPPAIPLEPVWLAIAGGNEDGRTG